MIQISSTAIMIRKDDATCVPFESEEIQTRIIQAEATVKTAQAQSEAQYRTAQEQSKAAIEVAHREAELQKQLTETEVARREA